MGIKKRMGDKTTGSTDADLPLGKQALKTSPLGHRGLDIESYILDNNFDPNNTLSVKTDENGKYTGEESETGAANIFNSEFAKGVHVISFLHS
jgi:hypothetical protein